MKQFIVSMEDNFGISVSQVEGTMGDSMQTEFTDVLLEYLRHRVKDMVNELFVRLDKADSVANELTRIALETLILHGKINGKKQAEEE